MPTAIFKIKVTGASKYFYCNEDSSLLVAMTQTGNKLIPVGCRAGGCGVCKVRVLEGVFETKVMSRAQITEDEEKAGFALACRIYPQSDMLIEVTNLQMSK